MKKHVIVIGGGPAGMEAAGQLIKNGYDVSLFEKDKTTGGHLNEWFKLFPDRRAGSEVLDYYKNLISGKDLKIINSTVVEKVGQSGGSLTVSTKEGIEHTADAVVIATGFDLFKSTRKEEYGYEIYDNVISSADLEAMFRKGAVITSEGKTPKNVGFVHCVGSRDEKVGNLYCSKLCCITAVKQAIEIKEHVPGTKVYCFYMDMRMGGAYYEELYREAQEEWGVNFIRGKVSEVSESINNRLIVKVEDTLAGRPLKMELDMLVLMAGMEMSEAGKKLASLTGLKTGDNRFFSPADHHYGSNRSNISGIFYAGACTMPMNITETISHARAAVADVIDYLKDSKR
ncbi:MAG: FAD-dependent oxidoreductase [Bacteroidia bacterium]|nr:FAD-dependent oxidoreductase [Bacteroidia bacterium]